ncbi:MAG: hypothetical protein M1132_12830 [Chloroflexi bacterium]|nr:hypothetical protein [Chloroflexota bacterium]
MNKIWILIGVFVMVGAAYSVVVPLGEAPDEVSHWAYVQYLAAYQHLPSPEGAVLGESHQPPLYYVAGALATFWIPSQHYEPLANPDYALGDPRTPNLLLHTRSEGWPYQGAALAWHLVRLLSVLMGAVTVWSTARISLELFPDREWIAVSAAAFVAFLPGFLSISSAVNNDNLVVMLSALGALQTVRLAGRLAAGNSAFSNAPLGRSAERRPPLTHRWRGSVILGLILGLALLAKLSGLVVWIFAAGVLAWSAYRTRSWKRYALSMGIVFACALVIVAPWMLYNWAKYGDPVGWSLVLAATPGRQTPMTAGDWIWWAEQLYTSFWGRFGGALVIRMAEAVYAGLGIVALGALAGWIGYAWDGRKGRLAPGVLKALGLCALFWGVMLAAHIRWTMTVLGTDQARQLFPGLPLLAVVLSAGLARLFQAREKLASVLWSAGALGVAAGALVYLGSVFSPGVPSPSAPVLLDGHRPADFGQAIRVVDYRVDRTQAAPGNSIQVQIEWQALEDLTENYWLLVQLGDERGAIANKDGVPSGGRTTTDWWSKGQIFVSSHTIAIPADAAPGTYTLRLGLHPMGRWEWLPVGGGDMMEMAKIRVSAGVGQ